MEEIEIYEKKLFTRDEINFLSLKKKAKVLEDADNFFLEFKQIKR